MKQSEAHVRLLDATHTFPSEHRFQVIVKSEDTGALITALITELSLDPEGRLEAVPSRNGTYTSVRFTLTCASAAAVLEVYTFLESLPYLIKVL